MPHYSGRRRTSTRCRSGLGRTRSRRFSGSREYRVEYDTSGRSRRKLEMKLPSVVSLNPISSQSRQPGLHPFQLFSARPLLLSILRRARGTHFRPRHSALEGGTTTWENAVTACSACNLKKAGGCQRTRHVLPVRRVIADGQRSAPEGRLVPAKNDLHESWQDYLYWNRSSSLKPFRVFASLMATRQAVLIAWPSSLAPGASLAPAAIASSRWRTSSRRKLSVVLRTVVSLLLFSSEAICAL